MSDIDLAITRCKKLESLLEKKLGARGKGLHEKVTSVEDRLPPDLIRKIRLVATVRNKIVHESDYKKIDDRGHFLRAAKDSERALDAIGKKHHPRLLIIAIILGMILLAAAAYWLLK